MKATAQATGTPVVRSLDLGWGYTKYNKAKPDGQLGYESFPSLAPRHVGLGANLSVIGSRNTKVITVDGTSYEVGPDATDLDSNDSSRNLNDQFIYTEQYKAVFYGALAYMGEEKIDLLVVGLPLSGMAQSAALKKMMEGTHKVSADKTVQVVEALVVPQPLGGLYSCLAMGEENPAFEYLEEEVNLIVDPGFLTFDFLLSNGKRVIENRSSAHSGGVSKVLRAIAESISTKFGIKYDNLSAIDKALRRRKIKINGQVEDLVEHIKNTRTILEGSVNYMKNIIGDGSDIDNIILLGGGSHVYQKVVESFYPKHSVTVIEDAQFANVRGFQLIGEQFVASKGA